MSNLPLKITEQDINVDDPWSDDRLNRKEIADRLTELLQYQQDALTVSLNGEWGSGKTFLLKRWQQDLKNKGFTSIYFNAWEDDFLDDPLIAIIGQLWNELKKNNSVRKGVKGIMPAAVSLLKTASPSTLNQVFQKFSGVDVAQVLEDNLKTYSEKALNSYTKLLGTRKDFKKILQGLADKISESTIEAGDGQLSLPGKPLIFIIDELDRCRPTFAIETLERIKHLFDIRHIVFVLGIDREQLGKSIQSVYGDIDVDNYLHRFIDLEFCIPINDAKKFFDALWWRYGLGNYWRINYPQSNTNRNDSDGKTIKELCNTLFLLHHFSLREIEMFFRTYVLLIQSTDPGSCLWPYLSSVLICLKLKYPSLYQKYVNNACSVSEVIEEIVPADKKDIKSYECELIIAVIYASYWDTGYPTEVGSRVQQYIKEIEKGGECNDTNYVPSYLIGEKKLFLESLIPKIKTFNNDDKIDPGYSYRVLSSLVKKIDFIASGSFPD